MSYFREVREVMRDVKWLNAKETSRYTTIVISTIILAALYFALTDTASSKFIDWLISLS